MNEEEIIQEVIRSLMSDKKHSFPYYRDDIHSEDDASEQAENLPLVYLWNEHWSKDGGLRFSLSVNGGIVAENLRQYMPRKDPDFDDIRDHIIKVISTTQNKVVIDMCQKFQCSPRQLAESLPR